jgi:alkylated DNA repair dioxygenase AlkB
VRHWDVALFDVDVPDGFRYEDRFIALDEELSLADEIGRLERRSVYLMAGESRHGYEHHIPPVDTLRYSVTFRTLRS